MSTDPATPVYCAFISYSSEDGRDALWLQKHLESYDIPAGFHGRDHPCGGTIGRRLGKVFRDRSDLAAGDLGPAIVQALQRSQALIVLCSPRGAKSRWVEQETLTFKRAGKGGRIFAVILDGEPYATEKPGFTADQECFPRALVNALGPDGEIGDEREVNQRLAADFRRHADGRTNGALKLIAGLLGLDLDDLAQRERRAERLRLRIAQRNEARAVNALGRVMAERAWAAMESGDPPLAIRYALAGLKATPANREEFRAALGAVLHAAERSRLLHGYRGEGAGAGLNPDGTRAVSLRLDDKPPKLADAETGREIAMLRGHKGRVYHVAFSPDGTRLLTAGVDYTMRLWDGATGAPLAVLDCKGGSVMDVAFSADGARFLTRCFDDRAHVWDTASGREIAVVGSDERGVNGTMALSHDGRRVVAAADKVLGPDDWPSRGPRGKTAQVWDAGSGTEICTLKGHKDTITTFAFSPDGNLIVTGSNDKTARVWRANGRSKLALGGHAGPVTRVDFSPDGRRILSVSMDGAWVWDAEDGAALLALRGHGDKVNDAAFSADGGRIVTASDDKTARIWDGATGREIAVLRGHVEPVVRAAFTPDGEQVVAQSRDGIARIWDTPSEVARAEPAASPDIPGKHLARSPDGTRIVTLSNAGKAHVVETASGRDFAMLSDPRLYGGKIESAAFSPDGLRIFTSSWRDQLEIWDAVDGRMLAVLDGYEGDAGSAVFNADASVIAAVPYDGIARVWASAGGEPIKVLRWPPAMGADPAPADGPPTVATDGENRIRSVILSPDGSRLLTTFGYRDQAIGRVWDVESGTIVGADLRSDVIGPAGAAFSPEAARVAMVSDDGAARIFEVASGDILSVLRVRECKILKVAFSPDGARVLTVSTDGAARVWAASNGRTMAHLGLAGEKIDGAAFSSDGTRVSALTTDRAQRSWDVRRLTDTIDALKCAAARFLLPRPGARTFSPTEIAADPLIRDVWLRDGRHEATDICAGIRGAPPMEPPRR